MTARRLSLPLSYIYPAVSVCQQLLASSMLPTATGPSTAPIPGPDLTTAVPNPHSPPTGASADTAVTAVLVPCRDGVGARDAGPRTAGLNRSGASWAESIAPDLEISALGELADWIEQHVGTDGELSQRD